MAASSSASRNSPKWPALLPLGHHAGKPPIPLHRPVTLIGSRSNARIHLTSSSVSKAHCLVVKDGPTVYIRDLCSRTHVYVNGEKVSEHDLTDGELIKIGSFTFKFVAAPRAEAPEGQPPGPAHLDVSGVDYPVPIDQRVLLIGRRSSCDVHLLEESVSTAHAVLLQMNGARHIRDLGSRTGTYVNGVAVHQHQLNPGDRIRIGETTLTYVPTEEPAMVAEPSVASDDSAALMPLAGASGFGPAVIEAPASVDEALGIVDAADVAEPALEPEPLEPELPPIEPAPVRASVVPQQLSDAGKNFSTPPRPPESTPEAPAAAGDSEPLSLSEDDLVGAAEPGDVDEAISPRRGWRHAPPVVPATDAGTPDTAELETVPSGATPVNASPDDSVLRFEPPTSADAIADEFGGGAGATATLDLAPDSETSPSNLLGRGTSARAPKDAAPVVRREIELPAPAEDAAPPEIVEAEAAPTTFGPPPSLREQPITAGRFTSDAPAESDGPLDALDLARDPEAQQPIDDAAAGPSQILEPQATEDLAASKRRRGRAAPTKDTAASTGESDTLDTEAEVEPPAGKKPARGRRSAPARKPPKKAGETSPEADRAELGENAPPERVAASRTRRKPKQPVAEQTAAGEIVDPALTDADALVPLDRRRLDAGAGDIPPVAFASEVADSDMAGSGVDDLELEPAGPIPLEPRGSRAEIVERTEPTVESALPLAGAMDAGTDPTSTSALSEADVVDLLGSQASESPLEQIDPMTDTALAREVHALTGDAGEPIEVSSEVSPIGPAAGALAAGEIAVPANTIDTPPAAQPPRWGANQENFLGGVPIELPPLPKTTFGQERIDVPAQPAARDELAPAADASQDVGATTTGELVGGQVGEDALTLSGMPGTLELPAEDVPSETAEHVEAVNALIDEILSPSGESAPSVVTSEPDRVTAVDGPPSSAGRSPADVQPADLNAPPQARPTGVDAGVEELSLDAPPEAADAGDVPPLPLSAPAGSGAITPPAQSRPVIPLPPPPARGSRRRRGDVAFSSEARGSATRDDERIPPYTLPRGAGAGKSVPGFDGLAMPPVREVDVFAQMSPPAPAEFPPAGEPELGSGLRPGGSSDDVDPFGGVTARLDSGNALPGAPQSGRSSARGTAASSRRPQPGRPVIAPRAPGMVPSVESGKPVGRVTPDPFVSDEPEAEPELTLDAPIDVNTDDASDALVDAAQAGGRHRPAVPQPGTAPAIHELDAAAHPHRPHDIEDQAVAAALEERRRKLRRVPFLLGLMLLVAGGAGAAAWRFVPVRTTTQASVVFQNFDKLQQSERNNLQKQQSILLASEETRRTARNRLARANSGLAPGFLDDRERYAVIATSSFWPESRRGTMVIKYVGNDDPEHDEARIRAMAAALVDANATLAEGAAQAKRKLEQLEQTIARQAQEQATLAAEIERLRTQGESAPRADQIAMLKAEVQKLSRAWSDSVAARIAAEAELQRLRQADSPGESPKPAAPAAEADEQVATWEREANDLTDKLAVVQRDRVQQTAKARAALDAALEEFQKQVTAAREAGAGAGNDPEFASYVQSAQRLQETTRSLIDDLVRRQQQQYGRLSELKTKMIDKMEERRAQQYQQDPKLREWGDQLEVARRQYNAAVGAGMKKESDDARAKIGTLESMIKAQQELLPKDPFYADAIAQLQSIIDAQQANIEEDRKRTDAVLEQLQKSFVASPDVSRLPERQKVLAAELEKRLAGINAARDTYNAAASASGAGDDELVKSLRTQLASVTANIEARRKQHAEGAAKVDLAKVQEQRQAEVSAKESELAALTKTEQEARAAYEGREKDLRDAEAAVAAARSSGDRLIEVQQQKDRVDRQLSQNQADRTMVREQAERAIAPKFDEEQGVQSVAGKDNRPMIAGASVGVVLLAFSAWILTTLHGASRLLAAGRDGPARESASAVMQGTFSQQDLPRGERGQTDILSDVDVEELPNLDDTAVAIEPPSAASDAHEGVSGNGQVARTSTSNPVQGRSSASTRNDPSTDAHPAAPAV